MRLYALVFYTDHVGLDPGLAALALGISIVWDAITDPIMGAISDRTRHRFGGRRGYLPAGGLWLAVGVLLVFWPPELTSQAAKFGWLLVAGCLLNTGMTVLSVPYMAMAGELTEEPHQRAVLFGWRFGFANVGALAAAVVPALLLVGDGSSVRSMPGTSVAAAAIVVATALVSWRATRSVRFIIAPPAPSGARDTLAAMLRNPTFRPLLLAYVVATAGIGVNAATFLYYYEHHLHLSGERTQLVLVVFLLVFTVSILAWVRLARRYGKRRLMVVGATVLGLGTPLLYLLAPPGGFTIVLVFGAIGLGAFVGCIVLIDAMLTDVLDHDLVRTGRSRAGLFFGVWRFASKLARAIAVAGTGFVLGLAGYREGQATQPDTVDTALVLLFGPGVGVLFLLAAVVLARYRFDERKQAQVRRILARRRSRTSAVDAAA
jgi:GPH family glycoside/pentoside/hexuronide:cation symporter